MQKSFNEEQTEEHVLTELICRKAVPVCAATQRRDDRPQCRCLFVPSTYTQIHVLAPKRTLQHRFSPLEGTQKGTSMHFWPLRVHISMYFLLIRALQVMLCHPEGSQHMFPPPQGHVSACVYSTGHFRAHLATQRVVSMCFDPLESI